MKYLYLTIFLILSTLLTSQAFAGQGHHRNGYGGHSYYGAKIDNHLDRKGNVIQHRFEHKAMRAEARGKYHKAARLRAKGERIHRHLDRKGDRIYARHDRRHSHTHRYTRSDRYYSPGPRVVYRNHGSYDSYFGVVLNQPGFSIGWGFYD